MNAPIKTSHARAFELLPWLVNGTLPDTERDGVEAHVRSCISCRRELKEQQRLHTAVRARRSADVSAEAGFDRLASQLDAPPPARVWRPSYAAARPFAIAAAAGVAVLALLVWFTPLPQPNDSDYATLATPPAGEAVLLDLVFVEHTTAAEMQQLLDDIGGEIVAGPTALGRYNVRLADERPTSADVATLLATLAADPRVRFAGRTLTEPQR